MLSIDRSTRDVATFTALYLLVGIVDTFRQQNWEFVFYICVLVTVMLAVIVIHKRIQFTRGALWCLSIWGLLHLMGGLIAVPDTWSVDTTRYVLYNVWLLPYLKYDQFVHAYGFAVATWACYQALRSLLPSTTPRLGLLVLCVFAGMGLGAFNEVMEFAVTRVLHENNVGGYENTGWDLVFNLIGSVFAALLIYYGTPPEERWHGTMRS